MNASKYNADKPPADDANVVVTVHKDATVAESAFEISIPDAELKPYLNDR